MSTEKYKSYFRPAVDGMSGYTPGEQPKVSELIKLNTNENPYPPSPEVFRILKEYDAERLRLYPDPVCDKLRDVIADTYGCKRDNVIAGNGSDDILTIVFRSFTDGRRAVAFLEPTYSLYPVLAGLQGCDIIKIPLQDDFSLAENLLEQAAAANLLIISRPNAPTGNTFPVEDIRRICREFDGVVVIDEAYADFSADNCVDLAFEFNNVIVSRTVSKSYSLAGIRLGFALGCSELIAGMMKVKDSYSVDALTQAIGAAAIADQGYLQKTVCRIKASRQLLSDELSRIGFDIVESQANFIFAAPPHGEGEKIFNFLRSRNIIVRYFPGQVTGKYIRITVGNNAQNQALLEALKSFYS
ncbi:histidinol-phosphate transaminase [Lentisphaerota bacterium ZTH]|nr:histidinol-phosphate transaminase [Lentisphaerota bacterium]WET05867.1 histidinol-phosphate transaminase [Lentisphaerota bacterium ZTH]